MDVENLTGSITSKQLTQVAKWVQDALRGSISLKLLVDLLTDENCIRKLCPTKSASPKEQRGILDMKITDWLTNCNLSVRAREAIKRKVGPDLAFKRMLDLIGITEKDFLYTKNCGERTVREIVEALAADGLHLKLEE